jgi:hypothetical protein
VPGHGIGADGDASVRSVLPGIRAGLACWSWRLVRAMAAPAIASSRSMTASGARRGVAFRSLHEARTLTPQRYLSTPCRVGRASQGRRRTPTTPRHGAGPTGIPLISGRSCRSSTPTWRARGSSGDRLPAGWPVPDGGRRHVPGLARRRGVAIGFTERHYAAPASTDSRQRRFSTQFPTQKCKVA